MKLTEKLVNYTLLAAFIISLVVFVWRFSPQSYLDFQQTILDRSNLLFDSLQSSLASSPSPKPSTQPTPTPYVYHPPTLVQQSYALALGALLSRYNNENITELASNMYPASLKPMIKDWWGISDRTSAITTLDWLKDEGHRTEFAQNADFFLANNIHNCTDLANYANKYHFNYPTDCDNQLVAQESAIVSQVSQQLKGHPLLAWDYGRIISVARWCYTLGWISEEEAWSYIMPAAQKLQAEYTSWAEYGEHYILGRAYWQRSFTANAPQQSILRYLTNPANKTPWTTLDWHTDLK